jgi:CheY-like chemotaxis protein
LIIETGIRTFTDAEIRRDIEGPPGAYVVVSVEDSGGGMDKALIQRIFDPFFTTKEKGKGTGLGLSMVYGVVRNHGGFVRVTSEPGHGSVFRVYLPVSGKPEDAGGEDRTDRKLRGQERILVVDDEEDIRTFLGDIFKEYGYDVVLAGNGREAISLFGDLKDRIDLVILDMVMPKMGGRETFLKLKGIDPDVRVLLSTGYSQEGEAQQILNEGVLGFIQKPYQVNELLAKVRLILDGSK